MMVACISPASISPCLSVLNENIKMNNHNQQESFTKPRPAILPNYSNRVLQHPSFLPLFMESGSALQPVGRLHQTVPVAIPSDYFYIEPSCGSRIPNIVTKGKPYECFRLNTPAPIMSTRPAPPNRPDPFSAGPYPTSNLGSPTLNMYPGLSPIILPWQMGPKRTVLQLTLEEDLAINSLLKLYHGDVRHEQPLHSGGNGTHTNIIDPQKEHFSVGGSSVEIKEPLHADGPHLQAVHLSLLKEDETWNQKHNYWVPGVRNPDHSFLLQEGSEICTGSPSASETSPSLTGSHGDHSDCTQTGPAPVLGERMNALGAIYSRLAEGQAGWDRSDDVLTLSYDEEPLTESPPASSPPLSPRSGFSEGSRQGVFWELPGRVSEGTMLESECEAVKVLLGLGEHGTL